MKTLARTITLLALAMVIAAPLSAEGAKKEKGKKGERPSVADVTLKRLAKANLTDEQVAKIKELAADVTPVGPEVRKAQAEARKKAAADGKKGKELSEAVNAALTDEQKAALTSMQEFHKSVRELLTDEQRQAAGFDGSKKGRAKKKKGGAAKKKAAKKKAAKKKAAKKKAGKKKAGKAAE